MDRVRITWQKSLAGLGAAQRIDSSYSDERNDLTGKNSIGTWEKVLEPEVKPEISPLRKFIALINWELESSAWEIAWFNPNWHTWS